MSSVGLPLVFAAESRWPLAILGAYCVLIAAASFAGGALPWLQGLSHDRLQVIISGVAGLMLGVAAFHLLPHAVAELQSVDAAVLWMMLGILAMFFLLRAFHFHQHGGPAEADHAALHATCGHDHDHDHGHPHERSSRPLSLNWLGIAFGLTIHTILDGIALASLVQADAREGRGPLPGLPAFLAVALHKPLDAVSIGSLMLAGGWSLSSRRAINVAFALMAPLGALGFSLGLAYLDAHQHQIVGGALALSAGLFLCIALADLLPEIEFHSHDRLLLSAALLIGVGLAYGVGILPRLLPGAHLH